LPSRDSIAETYFDFHRDTLYLHFDTLALLCAAYWLGETMGELECLYDSVNFERVQNLAALLDPDSRSAANVSWDISYYLS